jgi:hypothetical protein
VEITDSKLKVFTKQIYNHIIDEYGDDFKFTPQNIYDKIWGRQDEILTLLTSKMTSDIRKAVSFMVSLYSNNKDLDSIVKTVKDNYTYMDVIHYDNFSQKDIECSSCGGNGREDCDRCDSRGSESCDQCDGDGMLECQDCDGTGEIDGEPCYYCDGDGRVPCPDCDGDGELTCYECDGDGLVDCETCDGSGEMESSISYWDKYVGEISTISPDISRFPTDAILSSDQLSLLNNTEVIKQMNFDDSLIDEYEPYSYYDESDMTSDLWIIDYKETGILI